MWAYEREGGDEWFGVVWVPNAVDFREWALGVGRDGVGCGSGRFRVVCCDYGINAQSTLQD